MGIKIGSLNMVDGSINNKNISTIYFGEKEVWYNGPIEVVLDYFKLTSVDSNPVTLVTDHDPRGE